MPQPSSPPPSQKKSPHPLLPHTPPTSSSSPLPKNWPPSLTYLSALSYTRTLPLDRLTSPRASLSPTDVILSPASPALVAPSPRVRILPIASAVHPAHGQYGLFAAQQLPPDSLIVLYLGVAHWDSESDPGSNYDLSLDRGDEEGGGVSVDASVAGNEARFVNDYRGVRSEGPNAEFRDVWVEVGKGAVGKRIAVFVLGPGKGGKRARGIGKGEEIVVSYGKGFWRERREEVREIGTK
ncbi:hypothetical protein EV356DRAFT_496123 [Viridothelium virens]|uniref:SET domain-containing protein n=1 Tax=Viridothelium virens TaxID=1048519 RepID=A0A6A6HGV9_VIRVR|nr:hypothetical protein EV356DRAFT_496123 [Viridothelium virens]